MIKVITQTASESRAARSIWGAFQSGRPLTYIRTVEEQRVARVLREVGLGLFDSPVPVWTWSLTEGMRRENQAAEAGTQAPREALDFIAAHNGAAIFHLKDFHEPLRESAEIRRRLRDVYESCLDQRKFVVITSPVAIHSGGTRAQRHVSGTPAARPGRAGGGAAGRGSRRRCTPKRVLCGRWRAPCWA